jgi:radical SAM superfamily enzyme YgiQ (UPF0313 family)
LQLKQKARDSSTPSFHSVGRNDIYMSWKLEEKLRALLDAETGAVIKDPGGTTSVALVYPNTYRVGMSNLAVHSLYKLFNDHPNFSCERAFLPEKKDWAEHERTDTPILTVESQKPISEFDVVAFTVSFENDLLNVVPILELSKIPYIKEERGPDHPSIIAGGAAVTLNPKPMATIANACILGEFEAFFCHSDRPSETSKRRNPLLEMLEKAMDPSTPLWVARDDKVDLDSYPTQTVIHTPNTEFGHMHLIEVTRGCSRGCLFCAVPGIYGKFRMRSYEAIVKMIDEGFEYRKKFGLVGADILAHPRFNDIAEYILERNGTFSLSSVRVDRITPEVAKLFKRAGMKSMSLGIEAATDGLRSKLGKKFPNERCQEAVKVLAQEGMTNIRLYFMIGLPGETDVDIEAIAAFAEETLKTIREHAPKTQRSSSVECTITPFVPKPNTPFADAEFAGTKRINEIQKKLKQLLGKKKGIKLSFDSAKQAAMEYELAHADVL